MDQKRSLCLALMLSFCAWNCLVAHALRDWFEPISDIWCQTPLFGAEINQPEVVPDRAARTALDEYVAKADDSYSWKIVKYDSTSDPRTVIVDMVSQTWRTRDEVDRPEWQHWLTMAIPSKVKSNIGLLWIGGGRNGGDPPSAPAERLQAMARATGTVVAELKMVPNQALVFHNDGQRRTEDDLVAYTWDQFLKTGDTNWPARNPMVKSAVRAMDTITAVTATDKSNRTVDQFVVAGGSKRGWTTWLTGAVDKRVVGIIPIVIDVLNVKPSIRHHFAAYGFWAPSVGDYVEHRITERMDHPRMPALLKLVDPWYYRHRLTMPKFMINAAGDQFFPPDSSRYYFDDLVGPKHLRYVPNADHSLDGTDAFESLTAWYSLILAKKPAPRFSWKKQANGTIHLTSLVKPKEVRLWQATNPDARDFRLESLGPKYTSRVLTALGDGTYVAETPAPKKGWTAYFVELTYEVGASVPLKLTTDVTIAPDVFPFADKNPALPTTITVQCTAPNTEAVERIEQAIRSKKVNAVSKNLLLSGRESDKLTPPRLAVQLNWKPIGRFDASAAVITAVLRDLGCDDFHYRLESGTPSL